MYNLKCEFCNNLFDYKLNNFICSHCSKLNKLLPDINYFDYLGITKSFPIDFPLLETKYLELFSLFHPDNFINGCEKEQLNAINHSAYLNECYLTFKNISKTVGYLYKLNTKKELNLNSEISKELAFYFFNLNEEYSLLSCGEEIRRFKNKIQKLYEETLQDISWAFSKSDYYKIKEGLFNKLKYIESLQTRLK